MKANKRLLLPMNLQFFADDPKSDNPNESGASSTNDSKNPKDVSVYSDLINNKQKVIEKVLKDYEVVNYVIFSRSGYSKDLRDLANKNKKIILL